MGAAIEIGQTSNQLAKTLGKVSSGSRIVVAADDAAGSAVSIHLSAKASSQLQGIRNAHDGLSIIQTSEAAIDEVINIVDRSRELAVQASSETLEDTEREYVHAEYRTLLSEASRIAGALEFNGISIAGGETIDVQVGADSADSNRITIEVGDIDNAIIGMSAIDLTSVTNSRQGISRLDTVLQRLNADLSDLGAVHNRLVSAINNAHSTHENLVAANSRITDADMAHETSQMTALSIKQQAGVAAISQANQMSSNVVSLI